MPLSALSLYSFLKKIGFVSNSRFPYKCCRRIKNNHEWKHIYNGRKSGKPWTSFWPYFVDATYRARAIRLCAWSSLGSFIRSPVIPSVYTFTVTCLHLLSAEHNIILWCELTCLTQDMCLSAPGESRTTALPRPCLFSDDIQRSNILRFLF